MYFQDSSSSCNCWYSFLTRLSSFVKDFLTLNFANRSSILGIGYYLFSLKTVTLNHHKPRQTSAAYHPCTSGGLQLACVIFSMLCTAHWKVKSASVNSHFWAASLPSLHTKWSLSTLSRNVPNWNVRTIGSVQPQILNWFSKGLGATAIFGL